MTLGGRGGGGWKTLNSVNDDSSTAERKGYASLFSSRNCRVVGPETAKRQTTEKILHIHAILKIYIESHL